jgi:hypothetical protein
VVPKLRLDLPLVDEAGRGSIENKGGIDRCSGASSVVDVEQYLAGRDPTGGEGLAACLRSLENDNACRGELRLELGIDHPRQVAVGGEVHWTDCSLNLELIVEIELSRWRKLG